MRAERKRCKRLLFHDLLFVRARFVLALPISRGGELTPKKESNMLQGVILTMRMREECTRVVFVSAIHYSIIHFFDHAVSIYNREVIKTFNNGTQNGWNARKKSAFLLVSGRGANNTYLRTKTHEWMRRTDLLCIKCNTVSIEFTLLLIL